MERRGRAGASLAGMLELVVGSAMLADPVMLEVVVGLVVLADPMMLEVVVGPVMLADPEVVLPLALTGGVWTALPLLVVLPVVALAEALEAEVLLRVTRGAMVNACGKWRKFGEGSCG